MDGKDAMSWDGLIEAIDRDLKVLVGEDCDANNFYRNFIIGKLYAYAEAAGFEPVYIQKEVAARIGGAVAFE